MHNFKSTIKQLAEQNPDILIAWLYGSRAKGNAHRLSDYDLAVAFKSFIKNDPLEKRLHPECLALDWQQALGLHDFQLSIVDINQALPAFTLINEVESICVVVLTGFIISIEGKGIEHQSLSLWTVIIDQDLML